MTNAAAAHEVTSGPGHSVLDRLSSTRAPRTSMWRTARSPLTLLTLLAVAASVAARSDCGNPAGAVQKLVPLGPANLFRPLGFMVGISGTASNALCTGVLIGAKTVAVSATCLQTRLGQQPFKASIGGLNIGEQDGEWIQVNGISFHQGFRGGSYGCYDSPDIALLSLSRASSSQPIPILPNRKWRKIRSDARVNLEIFGWFSTTQREGECLSMTRTKSMTWGDCAGTISRQDAAKAAGLRCAEAPRTAEWFWDVGAPLTQTVDGTRYLLGLWSYEGSECSRSKEARPDSIVYTPLPPLRRWIESASFNNG